MGDGDDESSEWSENVREGARSDSSLAERVEVDEVDEVDAVRARLAVGLRLGIPASFRPLGVSRERVLSRDGTRARSSCGTKDGSGAFGGMQVMASRAAYVSVSSVGNLVPTSRTVIESNEVTRSSIVIV